MRDEPRDQVETVEALTGMEVPRDAALYLVVYGGDRSRVLDLPDGTEVTIGRSRGATLSFPADEKLSREHAVLRREGERVSVIDKESRNGTRLNGHPVVGQTWASAGDAVDAGSVTMLIARRAPRRHAVVEPETALEDSLEAEVFRATRYTRALALVMMRIDGPPEAVDEALDRIAADVRPMDRLANYGDREVALVLPETTLGGARAIGQRVLDIARTTPGVSAAAGIAGLPEHGRSPGALIDAARTALRSARRGDATAGLATAAVRPDEAPVGPLPNDDEPEATDPRSQQTLQLARKVALTPITVLLLGETGVGKEVVAELIHRSSQRASRPFVRLDCASLPPTLLESELFGHEKGAFTGADRRKAGYFEAAEGGTILLDEIGELPAALQSKLLAALERRIITRLGSTEEIAIDVRVIAATNRDLQEEVKQGRFREDLYYRLAVFTIFVPPLRDRAADIVPLATRFARQFAVELGQPVPTLTDEARGALEAYGWPGNVRELRNAIERAVVLTPEGAVGLGALPEAVQARAPIGAPAAGGPSPFQLDGHVPAQLQEMERQAIVAALEACGGNQTQAARRLGISRRSLIYKMERFGLKSPPRSR
ncbi:MAG TPA: sigma 54-interacting transcriptional regulator [Kofleriaceae bacterium]|nr:sigma 54-interacting transcriptional regulator [Kofleriaceae bacterium]